VRGLVPPPPAAAPLLRVLNSWVFSGVGGAAAADDRMYNDIPVYDDSHDNVVWQGRSGSAMGEGVRRDRTGSLGQGSQRGNDEYEYRDRPQRSSTWADDVYDRQPNSGGGLNRSFSTRADPNETFDTMNGRSRASTFDDNYSYSDRAPAPGRPSAPKPVFNRKASLGANQAIAKFTFDPDQAGDLGFKKGEVITILKKTDNETDWWTGRIGDREGIFPSNYVETV